MRLVTPGKCLSKKAGRVEGEADREEKCAEGRKSVHVNEPSCVCVSVRKRTGEGVVQS